MHVQHPLAEMIESLTILPGIGPRSAERLAFFMLSLPKEKVAHLSKTITETRESIRYCQHCFNLSREAFCYICKDPKRDETQLCLVAESKDIVSIERTGEFKGHYHVLGGLISPLDGIHPDGLRIQELVDRLKKNTIKDLILAINPTIEGDATILYLNNIFQEMSVSVAQLAYGLPMGSNIDYADEVTLQKAFQDRRPV